MKKHQLQTLSPIDGRYAEKCAALRDLFSEASLIRYRVITEIRWLQFLAQERDITHIKTMPDSMNRALQEIIDDFSLDDAVEVKKIESKINDFVGYWTFIVCSDFKMGSLFKNSFQSKKPRS